MTTSRRTFLQSAAYGALSAGMVGRLAPAGTSPDLQVDQSAKKLNLLILGGTGFLGPHIVERAMARGHSITLFNRGRTNADLFPELEKLIGDRDPDKGDGLSALKGRTFDAVFDTCGYFPRMARASAEVLRDSVGQYLFISTISVYADYSKAWFDETAPVGTMEDPAVEEFGANFENYGPAKALCEQAVEAVLPGRTTSIRPGLIVGPRDNVPRFTWWPVRVERGGEVLAPGAHDDPVQYIDVRDLAAFCVKCVEDGTTGIFNATGPTTPTTIGELLYGCKAVTGGTARFTWIPADFLAEHGVLPWNHMPVWVPASDGFEGFAQVSIRKAIGAGLASRPLAETVRDTLDWFHAWPDDTPFPWRGGIDSDHEQRVLEAWHDRDA